MRIKGWDLDFFNTGEWQVCDERLKDLEKMGVGKYMAFNPSRSNLFAALRATPAAEVKVAIIGQDPYPDRRYATGLAFSIPGECPENDWPPTLKMLMREYCSDLGVSMPSGGDLSQWADRGVLLWNAIPSVGSGKPLSHDWPEWACLTREIISILEQRGIVFAFLGQVARRYVDCVGLTNNHILQTSHPSPRGSINSKTPFAGSRLFSTINDRLTDLGRDPIDWRL